VSAPPRITAIIAAYNEADIIGQTVADLVAQNIAVHVIDHHSTDGTSAALEPFLQTGLVYVETFPGATAPSTGLASFSWARILARKEQLARELDADWFIHHDADEFRESPWRHLNLREGIELVDRLGYNAIDFAVLNFWPTHDRFDPGRDIREQFLHYEHGGAFDRLQVKCWKKTDRVDLVSTGGHDAQFESRRVFPLRFLLRHYPIRSQAHGIRKVFGERKPRFLGTEKEAGWHVQYDALSEDHSFVREPASLTVYDPDAVRVELQIEHRRVEDLVERARNAQLALEHSQQARDVIEGELETLAAAYRALENDRNGRVAEVASLTQMVDARTADLIEDQRVRAGLAHAVNEFSRQLLDIRQSWSWKLTAPLRAIGRLVGFNS